MRRNASTAWTYFDSLVFVAHRPGRLVEADFADYLADMYRHEGLTGAIVVPNNAAPSPAQRALILKWFKSSGARVAVISNSLLVRGAVTALGWFALPIKSFGSNDPDHALDYVALPAGRHDAAKRELRSLAECVAGDDRALPRATH